MEPRFAHPPIEKRLCGTLVVLIKMPILMLALSVTAPPQHMGTTYLSIPAVPSLLPDHHQETTLE